MQISPLKIGDTEIPLRQATPLQTLAYLRAGGDIENTYLLLAWVGDLGAAAPRNPGEGLEAYAQRVLDALSTHGTMLEIVGAADRCFAEAIRQSGILPTQEAVDQVGEASSEETLAQPSSTP